MPRPRLVRVKPEGAWRSFVRDDDPLEEVACQLRVRCAVPDCDGDFGRVTLVESTQPGADRLDHILFEWAPGLCRSAPGGRRLSMGRRTKKLRAQGIAPRARRPADLYPDWRGDNPPFSYAMPGESDFFFALDGSYEIECPTCGRVERLDYGGVRAALDEERRRW